MNNDDLLPQTDFEHATTFCYLSDELYTLILDALRRDGRPELIELDDDQLHAAADIAADLATRWALCQPSIHERAQLLTRRHYSAFWLYDEPVPERTAFDDALRAEANQ
jgi:hypothetical protein